MLSNVISVKTTSSDYINVQKTVCPSAMNDVPQVKMGTHLVPVYHRLQKEIKI